ncbi:MAG: hypothetical protein RLZZ507_2132 [Cyanobacteriota bacterium]
MSWLLQVCCTLRVIRLKSFSSEAEIKHIVEVNWSDRWQVYQRLNELNIPCRCETNQPLQVEIANPQVAVQLWSVVRQFKASRQDLIFTLENSWQMR